MCFFIWNDVDIASYARERTIYIVPDNINSVIKSLENTSETLF